MLSSILRIALLLCGAFVLVVFVIWAVQERFVFFPPPFPQDQGRGAERIEFVSTDGQPLLGFFVVGAPMVGASPSMVGSATQQPDAAHRLILHFHGNGDLAHNWIDWAQEVARRTGWSVFLAEYRGYGGLSGRPTYDGVMRDARATLALLQERYRAAPNDIVLYGHSLGSGVAAQLAAEQGARAVLLEAPLSSIVEAGRRSFIPPLSYVLPWISRIHWAPVDHVRKIDSPVWIVCGDADRVLPKDMGESVFAAASHQGEFLLVPGAQHGDVMDCGGENYWQWLSRALEETPRAAHAPADESPELK